MHASDLFSVHDLTSTKSFMSFLATTKQTLKRPLISTLLAVGLTLISWYFLADYLIYKPAISRRMHVESLPMWEGSGNNYAYLVTDEKSKDAVIIDPANPSEYAKSSRSLIASAYTNLGKGTSIVEEGNR